jgi:transposase
VDANARLGPAGRRELVCLMIEIKMTERDAAASLSVSPTTARRWKQRWREASDEERRSGAWLTDRSSRPHRSPNRTPPDMERRVCEARRRTGWGPRLIAGEVGLAHSTVHAILRRHGLSRAARAQRRAFGRYEWPCPGDLLHMDTKRYPRFARPGHAVTGERRKTAAEKRAALGDDYFHAIVDDHSRLAYGELLAERAPTMTAFVGRALAWFDAHGTAARRVEFPRFRGHLIAGPSGPAARIGVRAVNPAVSALVPPRGGPAAQDERSDDPAACEGARVLAAVASELGPPARRR